MLSPKQTGCGLTTIQEIAPWRSSTLCHSLRELLYGGADGQRRAIALERLRELVNLLPALSLPESTADAYETIRAELERKGEMIGNNGLWIASLRCRIRVDSADNNEEEFRRVRGLRLQNWAV